MRIDQFLWCVRVFKSRNIASNSCRKGLVKINGHTVKPSREPFVGDELSVRQNQIWRSFTIIDFPKSRMGAKWISLYINETTPNEAFEVREMQLLSKDGKRDKGTGRPTKKERRDIDDLHYTSKKEV